MKRPNELLHLSPDNILRNPDNPRLYFRPEELDSLMMSIKRYGIQVPITVYKDGKNYILIDGERRWRCALKLNLKTIPALVQPKPSPLNNLLLMFNIHALREQWDYVTIANKLPTVIDLFAEENGREPNEIELSERTGLTRGQIRRCYLLLDLPQKYRDLLLQELELPKNRQKLSEDFFIEMEKSLKTVKNRLPDAVKNLDKVRDALIGKYRANVISNVVDFRKISKIATSVSSLGIEPEKATHALIEIFNSKNDVGIADLFETRFGNYYGDQRIARQIEAILDYLDHLQENEEVIDESLRDKLRQLQKQVNRVLRG
jgi:ParB family chromosome partitioning protein